MVEDKTVKVTLVDTGFGMAKLSESRLSLMNPLDASDGQTVPAESVTIGGWNVLVRLRDAITAHLVANGRDKITGAVETAVAPKRK